MSINQHIKTYISTAQNFEFYLYIGNYIACTLPL